MGDHPRKAVCVSVEWWQLYTRDDRGDLVVREDGTTDETMFYLFEDAEAYVQKVAHLQGMSMKVYDDEEDMDVVWFDFVDNTASGDHEKIRKAVRSRKYLDAGDVRRLIERSHARQELFGDILDVEDYADDAEELPHKLRTGGSSRKAVCVSVEWWELYARGDDDHFTVREDGTTDDTMFYSIEDVQEYVHRIADFNDMRTEKYNDEDRRGVVWFDGIDNGDPEKRDKIRKAVRSRKYMSARNVMRLLERRHEHQERFEDTADVEDFTDEAEEPPRKKTRTQ